MLGPPSPPPKSADGMMLREHERNGVCEGELGLDKQEEYLSVDSLLHSLTNHSSCLNGTALPFCVGRRKLAFSNAM